MRKCKRYKVYYGYPLPMLMKYESLHMFWSTITQVAKN